MVSGPAASGYITGWEKANPFQLTVTWERFGWHTKGNPVPVVRLSLLTVWVKFEHTSGIKSMSMLKGQQMIHHEKTAKPVYTGLAGAPSGDTYTGVSYGDDIPCPRCGQRHPVFETQVVYEVCRNIIKLLMEQNPVPPAMMIGVLRGNNDTFLAACSPADGTPGQMAFAVAVQTGRFRLPGLILAGNLPNAGTTSRGGRTVGAAEIRRCSVAGHPIAGRCAAPKLIHVAQQQNVPRPWSLSEVFFDPALANPHHIHLNTAESCQTCRQLLPLLLCKDGPEVNLITFTGIIRAHWPGFF